MLLVSHVDCPSSARVLCGFFFFSSRRRHTRCSRDWSSDVCSSDLWPVSFQKIWLCFNQSQSRDWPLFYIVNSSARRGIHCRIACPPLCRGFQRSTVRTNSTL